VFLGIWFIGCGPTTLGFESTKVANSIFVLWFCFTRSLTCPSTFDKNNINHLVFIVIVFCLNRVKGEEELNDGNVNAAISFLYANLELVP